MYTEAAAAGIWFHDKCDRLYATLACMLETRPIFSWACSFKWKQQFVLLGAFLYLHWCLLTLVINY